MRIKDRFGQALAKLRGGLPARPGRPRNNAPYPDAPAARAAIHEAGHAVAAWASIYVRRVGAVSIDGQGNGKTTYERDKDGDAQSWDGIVIGLGGVAAELAVYGRFRSGNSRDDLLGAIAGARAIAERERAEDRVIAQPWDDRAGDHTPDFSRMFESAPSGRERGIIEIAHRRARHVIELRLDLVASVADELLSRGSLDERHAARILGPRPWALYRWP